MLDLDLPRKLAGVLDCGIPPSAKSLRRMEPELSYGRHLDPAPADARAAAVAVLLVPRPSGWSIPLVVRPAEMRNHAGQIALPGGAVDEGESTGEAALRELEEELGVPRGDVALVGALAPINLFVSNFIVHPWLAVCESGVEFRGDEREVEAILEVPLSHLIEPACLGVMQRSRGGIAVSAPCLTWGEHVIWGATAIVLWQVVELVVGG